MQVEAERKKRANILESEGGSGERETESESLSLSQGSESQSLTELRGCGRARSWPQRPSGSNRSTRPRERPLPSWLEPLPVHTPSSLSARLWVQRSVEHTSSEPLVEAHSCPARLKCSVTGSG